MRVAARAKAGGPGADGESPGHGADDPAADAALAREADAVGEVTGRVVGTAGQHEGVDDLRLAVGDNHLPRCGEVAIVGEEETGVGHVDAGHGYRAMMEIGVEDVVRIVVEVVETLEEVGHCCVAVPRRPF